MSASSTNRRKHEDRRRRSPADRRRACRAAGRHRRSRTAASPRSSRPRARAGATAARPAGARQRARPLPPAVADLVRRGRQAARDLAPAPGRDAADRPLSRRARRFRPGGARRRGLGHGPLHPLPGPHVAGGGGARGCARGGRGRRARDLRRLHARPQSARLRRPRRRSLRRCPKPRARDRRSHLPQRHAERRGADRSRRGDRRGGREPDVHRPVRPQRAAMVLGRAARGDRRAIASHRTARAHASSGDALSARLRRQRLSRRRGRTSEDARPPHRRA